VCSAHKNTPPVLLAILRKACVEQGSKKQTLIFFSKLYIHSHTHCQLFLQQKKQADRYKKSSTFTWRGGGGFHTVHLAFYLSFLLPLFSHTLAQLLLSCCRRSAGWCLLAAVALGGSVLPTPLIDISACFIKNSATN